ncbi:hypothetical protein [Bosea sp. (in: a-proteobacteria)]|uniref:hypothetical protein n=1 Tax=Bosea sp. (in: a-proteobacteria) TaxID=1871050 RepID=UPI002612CA0F|nr:hypothetical protein [Bosea sp. (in: a-proteobacteria)]MCO5090146.1 hypothetical protein [Bosea sp. (in: a-proteobacteria)]
MFILIAGRDAGVKRPTVEGAQGAARISTARPINRLLRRAGNRMLAGDLAWLRAALKTLARKRPRSP